MDIKYSFILIYGFIIKCLEAESIDLGTIIFANILYRHGDRTPVEVYPNDPYRNASSWPVPFGQLTNLGKHQHLLLGRWLRNRYAHLLSDEYSPYDIYIHSTDVDRTLMSAEANLAGLYPPTGKQIWDKKIAWMPIPIHTIPEKEDNILAGKKYCPRYEYELEKVLTSPAIRYINNKNKKLYTYLTEKTGKKVTSLKTALQIYNVLFIENLYNKTLPNWTRAVFPENLKTIAIESFKIAAYNKILQRLKSGLFLREMIEHMDKKSKNKLVPDRKLWMYSIHDETIANMLMTLNVFDPHCPPYTATILLELRRDSKEQHFVTVSYKNSTAQPRLLTIPGCTVMCPLSQFITLTKDVVPDDWDAECLIDGHEYKSNLNITAVVAILASSIMMLVILVVSIIGFIYWHYRREHKQYYLRLTTDPI